MAMIGGLAAGTVGYTGFGGTGGRRTTEEEGRTPVPEQTPSSIVRYDEPERVLESGKQYVAVFKTEKGDIRIELLGEEAPRAVNSFLFLAEKDFYDGLTFFFVRQATETIPGIAQTGDPTCDVTGQGACTGTGGPGYTLPLEANSLSHVKGAVVLAATVEGEEVHGSQFRILLADDPRLDGRETVFGEVVSGLEILTNLGNVIPCFGREPSGTNDCDPNAPVGLAIDDVAIEVT